MIVYFGCSKTSGERLQKKEPFSMGLAKLLEGKLSQFSFYNTRRIIFGGNLAFVNEQVSDQ